MSEFEGKVAMISGATGGIGLTAAEALGARGAKLSLTDFAAEPLEETAQNLAAKGIEVASLAGDIADEKTSEDWVAMTVERFGGVDLAFNNAGIEQPMLRFQETPSDVARKVFEVDALGVFYAMKHQIRVMTAQFAEDGRHGVILNTASMAGVMGAPKGASYAGAKHAVVGMTKTAARETARAGIRVNALCPSFFRTRMVMEGLASAPGGADQVLKGLTADIPMRRLGEPEELIPAILFALSPNNSFYTGQTLQINGGLNV